MEDVEAVPGAGVVEVILRLTRHEAVVHRVVDTPKRERGAELVSLSGVVVDDIEDHLEPGPVQSAHHGLELAHLLPEPPGGVADMGRHETDRVVAPVIAQPLIDQMPIVDEVMYRHELDRRHAELQQMIDDGVRSQPQIRAAQVLGHAGVAGRHAAHMGLIDHGLVPGRVG